MKVTVKLMKPWKTYAAGSIVEVDEATSKTLIEAEVAIVWTAADNARVEEQANMVKSAVAEAIKGVTPAAIPRPENRSGCKSFGELLRAVATGSLKVCSADGNSEQVDADGGYLVDQEFSRVLITRTMENQILSKNCQVIPLGPGASGLKYNERNDYDRREGTRSVNVTWTGEACEKTPEKATFIRHSMDLEKQAALYYVTDELLADTPALAAMISDWFADEFATSRDYYILRGSGTAQPLGILNSAALVEVTRAGAGAVDSADIANLYSRMYPASIRKAEWYVSSTVLPSLMTLTIGNQPVWLPGGTLASAPYGLLLGRPINVVECMSQLGTIGDVLFADMSQYRVIEKGGISANSSICVKFSTDQTTFRFVRRWNGQPVWSRAIYPNQGTLEISPFIVLEGARPTPTPTI